MTVRVCHHHHRALRAATTAHHRRRRKVVHRCPRHPHRHRRSAAASVPSLNLTLTLCSATKRLHLLRGHHPRPHHSSPSLLLRLRLRLRHLLRHLRHVSRVHPRRRRHLLHHRRVHSRRSRGPHCHCHSPHHLLHHLLHLSRGGHRVRLETHDGREEERLVLAREVGPRLSEVVAVGKALREKPSKNGSVQSTPR